MNSKTFDLHGTTLTRDAADLLLGFSREVIALIGSRERAESSSYTQGEEDCLRLNAEDAAHLAFQLNPSLREDDSKTVWWPLEKKIGLLNCGSYMYMGSKAERSVIHLYKHRETRKYLNLDESGQFYMYVPTTDDARRGESFQPISDVEAFSRVS
ncbi:hypothetical protein [Edaphobacter modestus]|uniref:Uncharacterized protein n=1 Tax=Edaphobacter modestus TaxID=388466 RepID=A0A4Q7Y030_9BACT|nr:hypothetical protein [Edaphobacter modestus]RZU28889.1 hypothetical protein BDD14_6471 [Edaphobacter modestus]